MKRIATFGLALLVGLLGLDASATPPNTLRVNGTPVTGFNRLFEEPIWDFGDLGTPGFSTVRALNPSGNEALPLHAGDPGSTLLATYIDPFWYRVTGFTFDDFLDFHNLPLRDVGVITDPFGNREPLLDILESGQIEFSRATSNGPITLGSWLRARGQMEIRCWRNKLPSVHFRFRSLIPNAIYSVWMGVQTEFNGNPFLGIAPFGGVPNAFTTDARGDATFERVLNFCPLNPGPDDAPVVVVDVVYHSDQNLYGGRPSLPRVKFMSGAISHSQLNFLVSGTPAE